MQVVAHNLAAMFTANQLKINTNQTSKSAEKLSSGYRINRAADDAAGLSISEKMRKQIRGLERGEKNIQDGISVCQVADGALAEVTDILQRVRELSIQAYNGTNSPSDRECIQDEVEQCLAEVDGISDRTKFNELYVLKGVSAYVGSGYYEKRSDYVTISTQNPDWLYVDDKIEPHNYTTVTQDPSDTNAIMIQELRDANGDLIKDADGNSVKVYYGPDIGDYNYLGLTFQWIGDYDPSMAGFTWTSDITDNPSAKMDFSGLLSATTADELYADMIGLLGVQIAFPCGTCGTVVQGVQYTGEILGYGIDTIKTNSSFASAAIGSVNLSSTPVTITDAQGVQTTYSGYFDLISHLGTVQYNDSTLTDDQKKAQVQEYAQIIAADLAKKTYDILNSKMQSHFDRAVVDPNDPYSVYVYDYRDRAQLSTETAADTRDIYKKTDILAKIEGEEYVSTGHMEQVSNHLMIQASGTCSDKIGIDLPEVSRSSLNLNTYTVSQYTTETTITYSESYKEKLQKWKETGYTEKTRECSGYKTHIRVLDKQPNIQDGEIKGWTLTTETYEVYETWKETYREYEPKPTPEEGDITITTNTYYDPTSLDVLDDAIAKVCSIRSKFGAYQNRLEHAYNVDANTAENTQASESRIRDTDMADEMVNYSKNNILVQAAQSFLAQNMKSPEGVLQLLQ